MKRFVYTFFAVCLSLACYAQPTLSIEDFAPGDKYEMVNCSDTGLNAGPAGANQSWKFNTLKPTDTSVTSVVVAGTTANGSLFPKANLAVIEKGGRYTYLAKNTKQSSLMMGNVDSVVGLVYTYSDSVLMIKRPFQYQNTFTDVFPSFVTLLGNTQAHVGGGTITVTADGWGSLQVNNRTYTDVLRIKVELNQVDSATSPVLTKFTTTKTTYFWYKDGIKNPLLLISKQNTKRVQGTSSMQIPKQYVAYYHDKTVSVDEVTATQSDMKAWFAGNDLLLQSAFEKNAKYDVTITSVAGTTIYRSNFVGSDDIVSFRVNDMPSGMYMVRLVKATGTTAGQGNVIKVFRQ